MDRFVSILYSKWIGICICCGFFISIILRNVLENWYRFSACRTWYEILAPVLLFFSLGVLLISFLYLIYILIEIYNKTLEEDILIRLTGVIPIVYVFVKSFMNFV